MPEFNLSAPVIAVVIPCFNEAITIANVIRDFKAALPLAVIYVFDNNSTDDTVQIARSAGARVINVRLRGKGNVVRRMFADVDADIYVMVDGDDTYDVSKIEQLVRTLQCEKLDMVVGSRVEDTESLDAYRPGHRIGNLLLTSTVAKIFGGHFTDMLSGYRVFSRRYVKSFPSTATGFEIETELTVHALELRIPYVEIPTAYRPRQVGSESKLSTFRDGWRILVTILKLFVSERPLAFFGIVAASLAFVSLVLTFPLALTYLDTGLVPRIPTAILSTGIMLCGILSLVCGVVLNTVTIGRQEAKRLVYLAIPATHFVREK